MNQSQKESIDFTEKTIGEIVAEDYRTAAVFEKYGIDFCCGGQVALQAACRQLGLAPENIYREIEAVKSEPRPEGEDPADLEIADLIDLIVSRHHSYLNENTGQIADYVRRIADVHGARHPELIEIATIFDQIAVDLGSHLREEEDVLFPALKRSHTDRNRDLPPQSQDRLTVVTSLQNLHREHEVVGDAIHQIRHLTSNYEIPEDACNTYAVCYRKLKEFENDLHKHVHLENNILFVKAAKLFQVI